MSNDSAAIERLNKLPDRAALEQLASALWSCGTLRGAAILVGAGVSRGARLLASDAPPPPLWHDLSLDMARKLYGASTGTGVPTDPLRLAEEYRVALGDAALAAFLRSHVQDETWEPGPVHKALLDLPWSDVLTTNYDTLLERAATDSRRGYDLVERQADLAHARSPRIIKLHGSLSDMYGVTFSEEDYRSYPIRCAAFVNAARQVFIENELCLLGFSGDDPNFLQWAGWVRDHLGGNARRIYLVGALDIAPVKRRLLESKNIVPIDIGPAVNDDIEDRHTQASQLFLSYLRDMRPADPNAWEPAQFKSYKSLSENPDQWQRDFRDPKKVADNLRDAMSIWRNDRSTYPGWLICPSMKRYWIQQGTNQPNNLQLALDSVEDSERRDALLELAWRHEISFDPVPPWLIERMETITTPENLRGEDSEQIQAIAGILLRAARDTDDAATFEARAQRILQLSAPDIPALVAYQRCLFARDRLDFEFVSKNLGAVVGDDPIWGMRRATLQFYIGESEGACHSVRDVIRDLKKRTSRAPTSVMLRSRFAWVRYLAQLLRWQDQGALFTEIDGYERLELPGYDPDAEFRNLDSDIAKAIRERHEKRDIKPSFEPGVYTDNSKTITLTSRTDSTQLIELSTLLEKSGIPICTHYVNITRSRFEDALDLAFSPTAPWFSALLSIQPSYSGEPITKHLSRISIARLEESVANELRSRIEEAISFWRPRVRSGIGFDNNAVEMLRLFIEALSRLTPRDTPETAKQHVRLAVDLACDGSLGHWRLNEQIGQLLKWALEAVPPSERHELSDQLLLFPLAGEKHGKDPHRWPSPASYAYKFIRRSECQSTASGRIAKFISALNEENEARTEALLRLLFLHQQNQLTTDEINEFATTLWDKKSSNEEKLPQIKGLYPHAFLITPAPKGLDAQARVYTHLFAQGSEPNPTELVAATAGQKPCIQPNETDAARLFDNIIKWRPVPATSPQDIFDRGLSEEADQSMALALALAAAPALAKKDRTIKRAKAALTFIQETNLMDALAALAVFYGKNQAVDDRIHEYYKRALSGRNRGHVISFAHSITYWLNLYKRGAAPNLPDTFRADILAKLERQHEAGLLQFLYLTRRLVASGDFSDHDLNRITQALNEIRETSDYQGAAPDTRQAASLSLLRAECVRLALQLTASAPHLETIEFAQAWVSLAQNDPLPEVRFAALGE